MEGTRLRRDTISPSIRSKHDGQCSHRRRATLWTEPQGPVDVFAQEK